MHEDVNGLSPAEIRRLAVLAQECGELVQAVGKALQHGYDRSDLDCGPNHRHQVAAKFGDVWAAYTMMVWAADLDHEIARAAG